MIVRATVTTGAYVKGVEYDLVPEIAQALIIQGVMYFVAVAPCVNREKSIKPQYEQR